MLDYILWWVRTPINKQLLAEILRALYTCVSLIIGLFQLCSDEVVNLRKHFSVEQSSH